MDEGALIKILKTKKSHIKLRLDPFQLDLIMLIWVFDVIFRVIVNIIRQLHVRLIHYTFIFQMDEFMYTCTNP